MPSKIPLRSMLYVPADNDAALAKAAELQADGFIFDLEDAVDETKREDARLKLARFLKSFDPKGRPALVRLPQKSEFSTDLVTFLHIASVTGFVLPKMETEHDIQALNADLDPSNKQIWAMVETARGLYNLQHILEQTSDCVRLKGLLIGSNDLSLETGLDFQNDPELAAIYFSPLVLGAKAHGLIALDGVYNNFKDEAGFAKSCANARRLGFAGKTLIHPCQIEAANAAFSPNEAQVQWANAVIAAFNEPENANKAVISINGEMVERLHLAKARHILAQT